MTLTLSHLTATCILGTAQSGLTLALSKDHKALLARPALLVLPDLQAHKAQQAQREPLA